MTDDASSPPGAAEAPSEPPEAGASATTDRRQRQIEYLAAILVTIGAILTAIASFQASSLSGDADAANTEALKLTLDANDLLAAADAQEAIERDWIFSWITAEENGEPVADFLINAMPQPVADLALEWIESEDDIINPFSDDAADQYSTYWALESQQLIAIAQEAEIAAECKVFEARVASQRGGSSSLAIVILAVGLVVAGIAGLLRHQLSQYLVIAVAIASIVMGFLVMILSSDVEDAQTIAATEMFAESGETFTDQEAVDTIKELCG